MRRLRVHFSQHPFFLFGKAAHTGQAATSGSDRQGPLAVAMPAATGAFVAGVMRWNIARRSPRHREHAAAAGPLDRFLSRPVQGAHRPRVALGYYHAVGEKFTERRGVCLRILRSPERSPPPHQP